jgi:pyruvate kinase
MSNLDLKNTPKTKIVATLGPASETEETIRELILAGMNVARLNCSHGDWDSRAERLNRVRKIAKELKRPIGILVDIQGPKIRTGTLPDEGVIIKQGEEIILTSDANTADYSVTASTKRVFIRNYPALTKDILAGQQVLIDDGLIRLRATEVKGNDVRCNVIFGGVIKSNKGVNLPESHQANLASITDKDREDIVQAVKHSAEFIALSFVKTADDVLELRKLIDECNVDQLPIKVIAKIEKPQAVAELDEILDVVDGVMVARGDLGVELEPEKVPMIQKQIISRANYKKKFAITATQMMDSMITKPFPTRAEVSDVANAILDGTDAIMLSNETATGAFPKETIQMMAKIALEVEKSGEIKVERRNLKDLDPNQTDDINRYAIAQAVETFSKLQHIENIVVFSCSGKSAMMVSRLRPEARIIAATTYEFTYNSLSMVWGVLPIYFDEVEETTNTIYNIEKHLIKGGYVDHGDSVVITGGLPLAARGVSNFIKIHKCDGSILELKQYSKALQDKKLGPSIQRDEHCSLK